MLDRLRLLQGLRALCRRVPERRHHHGTGADLSRRAVGPVPRRRTPLCRHPEWRERRSMKGIRLTTAVAVLGAAVLLAGCGRAEPGDGESAVTSTAPPVTRSMPHSMSQLPRMPQMPGWTHHRAQHTPSRHVPMPHRPVVASGRYCAWLAGLDAHARRLTFDVVQWLTGAEADAAFHRDHPEATDPH